MSADIFALASRHAEWLAARRAVIAGNIANASTPGYRARDAAGFDAMLGASRATLAATRPGHLASAGIEALAEPETDAGSASAEVTHSGNSVSLDAELIKSAEVARGQALNAGVVRSFHRLLLASIKG